MIAIVGLAIPQHFVHPVETGPGHAEATIMNYADRNGLYVSKVTASWHICYGCSVMMQSKRVQLISI